MRTIGVRSNILVAIAAACGVIAALGRPWYGPPLPATGAEMEDMFTGIGRALLEPTGTSGWDALQTADRVAAGLAAGTALLLVLALVPSVQPFAPALARWTSLATVAVIAVELIGGPGGARMSELRHGGLLALAAALVLLTCAWTVATAPSRRRTPVKPYTPPPPPVSVYEGGEERPVQF
jgi:hypothetical protein